MKRSVIALLLVTQLAAQFAAAEEKILPAAAHAAGANGTFWRTELQLFNPSTEAIAVEARLLSTNGAARTIAIGARSAVRYDDVLDQLFQASGVAAIQLRSDGAFEATSRTFTTGECGTFGQFIPVLPPDAAMTSGVLLHLADGEDVRANAGFVNLSDAAARILIEDKTLTVAPRSLLQIAVKTGTPIRFDSDTPVLAYASIVDNISGDATFVAAVADRGTPAKVFAIEARQFQYTITPGGTETIHVRQGDLVVLRLHSIDALHGFIMPGIVDHRTLVGGAPPIEVSFVAGEAGTFRFFCTIECGSGHHGMAGQMIVSPR